jgi:hypothetical protein
MDMSLPEAAASLAGREVTRIAAVTSPFEGGRRRQHEEIVDRDAGTATP